ncbi:MAG TPA: M57 family metalloprotease [Solirubrobacteraceae bacterium]|nr:M57 family metalloprotease [Solirubrobacteraceae bacterium]
MSSLRTHLRRLRRVRPRHAAPLAALLVLGLTAWPAAGGHEPRPWPHGQLTYFDASGSAQAVDAAARRWNRSGARVHLTRARTRASATVVFVSDRRALRARCGTRCLGLSSSIGRPRSGRVRVLLDPQLTGPPTALNVWVAMHELGHVLGLRHREGTCSLMNAQAYDDACTFGGSSGQGPLPCGPASGDVAAAARLYGRDAAARPCR